MKTQTSHWNPFSKQKNQQYKLVTVRVPNHIVADFDQLVKFKRGSRTSYGVGLMDTFIRNEIKRLEESNRINEFISDIVQRSQKTDPLKRVKNTFRRHKDDYNEDNYEPPMIPTLDDDFDWEERLRR